MWPTGAPLILYLDVTKEELTEELTDRNLYLLCVVVEMICWCIDLMN